MWVIKAGDAAPTLVDDSTLPYWRGLGYEEWEPGLAAQVSDPATPVGAALRAAYVTVEEGPLNVSRYIRDHDDLTPGAAINQALNALDALGDARGGVALFERGVIDIDVPIESGQYTRLVGEGRNATLLRPTAGFPAGSPLIRMGKTGVNGALFGCRIEDLTVDLLDRADIPAGVYSERWNEKSGAARLHLTNVAKYGIHVARASGQIAQGYTLHDIEVGLSTIAALADAVGVYCKASPRAFDTATVNSANGTTKLASTIRGMVLDGFYGGRAQNLHHENVGVGLQIGEAFACSGFTVQNLKGQSTSDTNLKITGGLTSTGFNLFQIIANGTITNLLDEVNGLTVYGVAGGGRTHVTDALMWYLSGTGTTGSQPLQTSSDTIGNRFTGPMESRGQILTRGGIGFANATNPVDSTITRAEAQRLVTESRVQTSRFVESTDSLIPFILKAPGGTRYKITVTDAGTLAVSPA